MDIISCLKNCSNHGYCDITLEGKFVCICDEPYAGSDCSKDSRLCSTLQCMNNGTCNNLIVNDKYDFNCSCQYPYYGQRCQFIHNLCRNKTCFSHGICFINKTEAECACFYGFKGKNCEITETKTQSIQTANKAAVYSAISIIGLIILLLVIIDIFNLVKKIYSANK